MDYDEDYDEKILMSIKSNGEDENDMLEFLPEPDVTTKVYKNNAATNDDDDGVIDVADTEPDPLQEQTDAQIKTKFQCLFTDEQLLQSVNLNIKQEKQQSSTKGRAKRSRLQVTEYKSLNGRVWTLERTTNAAHAEVPIPEQQPTGKGPAARVSNVLEPWTLLFDEPIMRHILQCTNESIRKTRCKLPHGRATEMYELRAWLGLNYLCGVFRNAAQNGPLEELWTPELGNAIFRATMTYKRFIFLAEHLCLTEQPKNHEQKLKFWNKFIINCRSYYAPSGWCTLTERNMYAEECVTNKRTEKLERVLALCDAKTLYMANALITQSKNSLNKDILQLVCDIKSTGRNVALEENYTNLELSEQLLQRQLTTTGILARESADYPLNGDNNTATELFSNAATLTANTTTANNDYLLSFGLSAQLNLHKVQEFSMQAAQLFQQKVHAYSTQYATPSALVNDSLKLLHLMLDYCAFNAWILLGLSTEGDASIEQRDYLRQLGLYLTMQRLQRRLLRTSDTTLLQKIQICEILGTSAENFLSEAACKAKQSTGIGLLNVDKATLPAGITLSSRHCEKPRRCKPCSQSKRQTKARTRCQQCLVTRCHNHLIARCFQCTGITPSEVPSSTAAEEKDD